MNFKNLKESSRLNFIKIEERPQNTIRVNKDETSLSDLCKEIGAKVVFYTSKSIKEQLRDLAPEAFEESSDYFQIIYDIRRRITNKMNTIQSHFPDYKELNIKLLDYVYFVDFLKEDDIVEYQIFVPFNGIFFTFDAYRDGKLSSLDDITDYLE